MRRILTIIALILAATASIFAASPGSVLFSRLSDPALDFYTAFPTPAWQQWFRDTFFRMEVFSPYFDTRVSWYPRAVVYLNLYGIDPLAPLVVQHPDWLMHDAAGNILWIPFACDTVTCAHYAGDFSNPSFRAYWIQQAKAVLAKGYTGILLDDVNMDFRASNAFYGEEPPIDFSSGQPMTIDVWRAEMASFLEQIRQAFPGIEIGHNSMWYANTACCFPDFATLLNRDLDPNIQRQIAAADVINMERGIGSDDGLTGGTGIWSLNAEFSYIDRVHAAGKSVTMAEYTLDRPGQEYALAGYFLISAGGDRYGDLSTNPDNFWTGFNVALGTPLSPRVYNKGLYQRNFTGGVVLLNEPQAASVTLSLPEPYSRLDGTVVTSVTLGAKQGAILIGPGGPGKWVSDLTPTFSVNGFGAVQRDSSTNGSTLSLKGVKYLKGLGAHANSELHYALGGGCSAFTATVGVDDEVPVGTGSADFQVWADGFLLFDSGHMTSGSPARPVRADLTGRAQLSLVVTDGGLGNIDSHSDWANARLICGS